MHPERAPDLALFTAEWLLARDHEVRLMAADAAQLGCPDLGVEEGDLAIGLDLMVGKDEGLLALEGGGSCKG